jgi:hypothetical protein
MVGLGQRQITSSSRARADASSMFSSRVYVAMRFIQLRSAPAQKAGPLPASTTQRTSSRLEISRNTAVSSAITSSLKALRTSGRFRVTVEIPRS